MRNRIFVCVIVGLFALTLFVSRLFAVEGGLGRPISGAAIAPYAGLVPPEPGLALTIGEAYYDGSIGGAIPLGNFNLNLGIEMVASFTPIAISYIWPTTSKQWNFASAISIPLAYVEVEADVTLAGLTARRKDHDFGLFDMLLRHLSRVTTSVKPIISLSLLPFGLRPAITIRID